MSRKILEYLTVEKRGSVLVGAMSAETPMVAFRSDNGEVFYWVSDSITDWELDRWDKWDRRKGTRFNLDRGVRVFVTAFVHPSGNLYRVTLKKKDPTL